MLTIMRGNYEAKTRKELHEIAVVRPEDAGGFWQGVQHGKLVDSIIQCVKDIFGYRPLPGSEVYAVSANGCSLVGGFQLGIARGRGVRPLYMTGIPQETVAGIGFSHGNDLRKSLRIYAGGQVSLCSNGLASASHTFRHKHTSGLALIDWLEEGLQPIIKRIRETGQRLAPLYDRVLRDSEHDKLILQLARLGVVPWRLLGEVDSAWKQCVDTGGEEVPWSPEHEWGFERTLWDWYNAVTHVLKKIPPLDQLKRLERALAVSSSLLPKKVRNNVIDAGFTPEDPSED